MISQLTLSQWNEFDSLRSNHANLWQERMPQGLTTRINIFKARYDIARRLSSMGLSPNYEDDTTMAYLAGTRLLLAYSAAEAFMRAEDLFRGRSKAASVTTWLISRKRLASDLPHGGLTARTLIDATDPEAAGRVKAIAQLAEALLDKCDEKFSGLFNDLSAKLFAKS